MSDLSPLGERVSLILKEQHLKKKEFARATGITPNYVSLITMGRVETCSRTLALLIEKIYGYSADWLLTGAEPRRVSEQRDQEPEGGEAL